MERDMMDRRTFIESVGAAAIITPIFGLGKTGRPKPRSEAEKRVLKVIDSKKLILPENIIEETVQDVEEVEAKYIERWQAEGIDIQPQIGRLKEYIDDKLSEFFDCYLKFWNTDPNLFKGWPKPPQFSS